MRSGQSALAYGGVNSGTANEGGAISLTAAFGSIAAGDLDSSSHSSFLQ